MVATFPPADGARTFSSPLTTSPLSRTNSPPHDHWRPRSVQPVRGRQHVLAMFEGMHMTHPDQMFAAKSSRVVREVVTDAPGEYGPRCICYKVIIYAHISSNISAPCAHVSSVLTPFVHSFFVFAPVGRCFFQAPTRSPASATTTTTGE